VDLDQLDVKNNKNYTKLIIISYIIINIIIIMNIKKLVIKNFIFKNLILKKSFNNLNFIIFFIFFIIFIYLIYLISLKLNFKSKITENFTWSKSKTQDFLLIQDTINKHKIFDVDYIQKYQASEKDLDYFLQNGYWYWNDEVIQLYKDAINSNPYVRINADDAVNYARSLYNQNAILKLLFFQSREGDFLINGIEIPQSQTTTLQNSQELPSGFGNFGYKSGLKTKNNPIIKCNLDDFNNSYLEKIEFKGKGGIFGEQLQNVIRIEPEQLEILIPGFKFTNYPCNPCNNLKNRSDYSCGYSLYNQPTKLMSYLTTNSS